MVWSRGARFHYRIIGMPLFLSLAAVICGKWTSLFGKSHSPVTVNILYSESHINAGNMPVMSRSQPVIAGNYLQPGGAMRRR